MGRQDWVSFMLIVSLSLTHALTAAQDVAALKRPVALTSLHGTSAEAMTLLMAQAGVSGGIISIYEGCAEAREYEFALAETTLRRGLDYVSGIDDSRSWVYRDGVFLVGFKFQDRTILNTELADVDIDPNDALSLSTQRLLDSPEVREQISKSGLIQMNPPLGFSAIPKPGDIHRKQRPSPRRMHLHRVTLETALNALASTREATVWHYEQFVCGNRSSFRLGWAVSSR